MDAVYLDHNATTPLDTRVRAAMLPWLAERWGNPSSIHRFGQAAREAVEAARDEVAALLGAQPLEIVFCGSGTEALNAVVRSAGRASGGTGHLVVSGLEHPAVRLSAADLATRGARLTAVPADPAGVVEAQRMIAAFAPDTALACLMLANNEVGTLQPVAEVAAACRARGIPLLCDAVQAVGKVAVGAAELGVDYLVLTGHKFHGPLGSAALWIRGGAPFEPLLLGGSQERRRRASTVNVPAVVGLGEAARLARLELAERQRHLVALRDRFERGLAAVAAVPFEVHCATSPRLPNVSHLEFPGLDAQALAIRLDLAGFAVSTGAACASGSVEPSPVLLAMGLSAAAAASSVRVSFGLPNTADEVDAFLAALARETAALAGRPDLSRSAAK